MRERKERERESLSLGSTLNDGESLIALLCGLLYYPYDYSPSPSQQRRRRRRQWRQWRRREQIKTSEGGGGVPRGDGLRRERERNNSLLAYYNIYISYYNDYYNYYNSSSARKIKVDETSGAGGIVERGERKRKKSGKKTLARWWLRLTTFPLPLLVQI